MYDKGAAPPCCQICSDPFEAKCGGDPLGFYLDSSMECNKLTAQRLSAASLCLSHFLPFLTHIHIHSVRAEVLSHAKVASLSITKTSRNKKREGMRQRKREYTVLILSSCKPVAPFHCRNSGTVPAFQPPTSSFSSLLPHNVSVPEVDCSYYPRAILAVLFVLDIAAGDWSKTSFMTATTFF